METFISHKFTELDRVILRSQIPFLDCLGKMFGENCEIVLHSFENLHASVIHIVNGHVTNRKIGAPVTNIALEKITEFTNTKEFWDVYFSNFGEERKPFKSSSTLIVNFDGVAIGMICMNYSLDVPMSTFIKTFTENSDIRAESFSPDMGDLVNNYLRTFKHNVYSNNAIASKNKVKEIIRQMHQLGLFSMPMTTKIVSSQLGISSATVYKHLRQIKAENSLSDVN